MISGVGQSAGIGLAQLYASERQAQSSATSGTRPGSEKKSADEERQIDRLVATDRNVRAHEQAHLSAGADLVRGGATFEYATGPDGKRYAVGGEVSIDSSKGRSPEETISKAARIRAAALAPADPSAQDRQVAAAASQLAMEARQEMVAQAQQERQSASGSNGAAVAAYQSVAGLVSSVGFKATA